MTDDKKSLAYQYACENYLRAKSLEKLRAYGRAIGVNRSTAKSKSALINEIVGVLSGRLAPVYTNKGAPVLNRDVDPEIPEQIKLIYEKIYDVKLKESPLLIKPLHENYEMNVMVMEEPERELRQKGVEFVSKCGQLKKIDDVYYLLPLDGKDNGERVVMHAEIVSRNELREGDVIVCDAAKGNNAFVASTLTAVNGDSIEKFRRYETGNDLPCEPRFELHLYDGERALSDGCKFIEWVAPMRRGQRCCLIAPPKTGKSRLLQEMAYATKTLNLSIEVFVLLIDQPLETVSSFARFIPSENLLYTTYEDEAERQVFLAEFILERAKRYAESGKDVVLFIDSVQALAKAFNDTEDSVGGKTLPCGLESKTLQYIKKYLGAARCNKSLGSLTIIGTATTETGNPFDEVISSEIAPLLNHEIRLSAAMAYKRRYPALDAANIYVDRRDHSLEELRRKKLVDAYIQRVGAEEFLESVIRAKTFEELEEQIKSVL